MAELDRLDGFWSSADLTGNQTKMPRSRSTDMFWSSADLTGNQTGVDISVVQRNDVSVVLQREQLFV